MSGRHTIVEWPETSPGSLDAMKFYLTSHPVKRQFVAFCPSRPITLFTGDPRCNSPEIETIRDFTEEQGWKYMQEKPAFRIFRFDFETETIEEVCVLDETGLSLEEISRIHNLPIIREVVMPKGFKSVI